MTPSERRDLSGESRSKTGKGDDLLGKLIVKEDQIE
jgi:hypothetical protein